MTIQPTDTLHVRANTLASTDSEFGGNFSITGPISETLGYVFSAGYNNWGGNARNLVDGKKANGRETLNTRAKLRWRATPDVTFTLSGNYLNGNTTVGRPFIRMFVVRQKGLTGPAPNSRRTRRNPPAPLAPQAASTSATASPTP